MATTKRHTRSKSAMKAVRKAMKESRSKEQNKAVDKNLMKSIVATVLQKEIKDRNRIRMPKYFLRNLVINYQPLLPTLTTTKKSLENAVAYQRKKLKTEMVTTNHQVEQSHGSPNNVTPDKPTHCKEVRPFVNSKERKKDLQLAHAAAYNHEVTQKVAVMRQISKTVPQQAFQKIVDNTKKKYNLPDETEIQKRTIIRRIERNKMFVMVVHERQGAPSPLAPIEPSIIELLVISMSKIRQCLSSPEIKDLVNSCIDGTDNANSSC
jgi:hypothetical protein